MKKAFLLINVFATGLANAAQQQGPLNAQWFYDPNNPYRSANELHQERRWQEAEDEYEKLLQKGEGNQYDQTMAELNMAPCQWAQEKESVHWRVFDELIGIEKSQRITSDMIKEAPEKEKKSILIILKDVGIGDGFHFFPVVKELKRRTEWDIILSVPNFLIPRYTDVAREYGVQLVGARGEQPKTDYATHIIGLLGHLAIKPTDIAPSKAMFTAPDEVKEVVNVCINPFLKGGKKLAVLFLGENRSATVPGGKQVPHDPSNHGRHLSSEPFNTLLKNNPELTIIDCGSKDGKLQIDEQLKHQYTVLPAETTAFDTTVALALAMNANNNIIGFAADQGPANVFARALTKEAQRRMAFVIPNAHKKTGEYDMRMEGKGNPYIQMISNCLVYKCENPDDQTEMVAQIYKDLINNTYKNK